MKRKPRPCPRKSCREARERETEARDRVSELDTRYTQLLAGLEKKNEELKGWLEEARAVAQAQREKPDLQHLLDRSFKELNSLIEMKRFMEEMK